MRRTTIIFWKGVRSRPAQSKGNFSFSGDAELNHSPNRGAASTKSLGSFANSSISHNAATAIHALSGSHGRALFSPVLDGALIKN